MKSFFTKLGTLLLCGVAVAVVGCTDFSQDIQAGDEALKGEIERVEKSTASTIAELKASISALEAAQKKIEADYAKKSDLDAAKKALQDAIEAEVADLNAAISAINTTLDGKADKSAVEALQKTMADAIAEANKTIANLEAAQKTLEAELAKKADKAETDKVAADVETLKNGYQETVLALTELQNALNGKASQEDLELTQNALKTVTADVESLKQAYMEIVLGFQQFQADLASKASQTDLELAEKDIEALKTASAEAVFAIANLNTAVAVLEARVGGIENELNKAKVQIAEQTTQLTNLATALEQAKGDLEDEAELREAADKALQTEVAQLIYGLTNLQGAYDVHIQEYEAYKETLKKQIDDLAAQDGALATSMLAYYDQAIIAVEESEAALRTLVEEEIAKVTNLIAQERTEIEGMIAFVEESFKKADEELFTLVQDSLITVVYNTIYNYDSKYEAMFATVDEKIAAMDDEFRFTLNSLAQEDSRLDAMISAVGADLEAKHAEAMMAVVTNRTEIENMIAHMDEELKGLISGLTERVAANEEAIKALQAVRDQLLADVEELQANVGQVALSVIDYYNLAITAIDEAVAALNDKNDKQDAKIEEVSKALATLRAQFNERMQHYDSFENDTANKIKELQNNLAAAETKINDLFNLIVSDLNGRIQSVVFVPGHSDLKATMDIYHYGYDETQIVVKATYQVTPAAHVVKVGKELDVQGVLQATSYTRAAADEYVWAEAAYVTDINESTGKFDVEYVFNYDELEDLLENKDQKMQYPYERESRFVLGTFVQHPEYVMPAEDVDDNMGVVAETYFKNYKVSDFAAVADNYKELNYAFVKEGEDGLEEYLEKTEAVAWSSANPERRPYAGYEVMIQEDNEYLTLAEMAEIMHVEEAAITPKVGFKAEYFVADDVKSKEFKADAKTYEAYNPEAVDNKPNTCNGANKVIADDVDYRVFTIGLEQTNANAIKLIGHKVTGDLYFFFGPEGTPSVLNAKYNYIIDYRTYVYNLVGGAAQHRIDWTYELANALADKVDPADEKTWKANAKEMHGDETRKTDPYFVENFTEYDIIPAETNEGEPVDYKATIKNFPAVRTVKANAANVKLPVLEIMPRTGIIHDIAAVSIVENYEFIDKDVLYNFTNTHTDDQVTYTKVQFNYDLTLGHMPLEVAVTTPVETINYKAKDWTKTFDFSALTAQAPELAGHGFGTAYNPTTDDTNLGESALYASETPARLIDRKGSSIAIQSGKVTVTPEAQQDIFNNEAAKSSGYLTRTVTTWYGTKFIYKVPFTVVAPAYKLDINPLHVAEGADGYYATANYVYADDENRTYTVVNSFMQDYFRVLNFDKENDLRVNFQIVSKDANDKSTPKFLDNSRVPMYTNITKDVIVGGTFKREKSELAWDDYHYTSVDVVAQLLVNGVAFGDPVKVTILAQDPLELRGAEVVKNWVANEDLPIEDVLSGAEVTVIDQTNYLYAHKFAANTYNSYYNKAKAYDAKFTVEKVKVYFFENDGETKTDVPAQYYSYDTQTRKLVFKKETANLMTAIFAEFDVTMDYTLDCDEPETVKVVYKVPAVEK